MRDVRFYVVTRENLAEFIDRFKKDNDGELVFFAMSVKDYENLSVNVAELKRFIEQQDVLILYYEDLLVKDSYK